MKKIVLFWSSGKDAAYCLQHLLENDYEVAYLITTISKQFNRVAMHGIPMDLLEKQVKAIGIPLIKMVVRTNSYEAYDEELERVLLQVKRKGITEVAFGDVLLEDLKAYRTQFLENLEMKAVFPLWGMETGELANNIIKSGFKSTVCCTNDAFLGKEFIGKGFDFTFLKLLEEKNIDTCGEYGEFHTFCYDGPIFKKQINFKLSESIYIALPENASESDDLPEEKKTKGFWYANLNA